MLGKHIRGAAKIGTDRYCAAWGCGDGFYGQSYAIAPYVDRFIILV